jgi:hypothetical protein
MAPAPAPMAVDFSCCDIPAQPVKRTNESVPLNTAKVLVKVCIVSLFD